jgi:hypothetical protein
MVFKVDCANQIRLSTPVPSRIHSRRLEATTTCPAAFALMLGESAVASCGHPFSGGLSGYVPKDAVSTCSKSQTYSITSSARPSSGSGTMMPTAFAVFVLMINSTFVTC